MGTVLKVIGAITLAALLLGAGAAINGTLVATVDYVESPGLLGTYDSTGYRVAEIEGHSHNRERWFGISGDQSGDDWAADTLNPFQAISGAGDYGADANDEAKVLGADDTPAIVGMVKFDAHRITIVSASSTTQYKLRVVYGTGTMADAITAGQYSELVVKYDPAIFGGTGHPVNLRMLRLDAGTKVWVQCKNASNNATIDFFIGLHEYEG